MSKLINISLLFFVLSLLSVCTPEQTEVVAPKHIKVESTQKRIYSQANSLAINTFKTERKNQNSNVLISSLSINSATAFILFATKENTKQVRISMIPNEELIKEIGKFNNLIFKLDESFQMNNKTVLNFNKEVQLNAAGKEFLQAITPYEIKYIRAQKNTGKPILEIESDLSVKFSFANQTNTCESPFYLSPNESKFVEMLKCENTFNFYSDEHLKAVELPIGQGNFNALFLIPENEFSLEQLTGLINPYTLNRIKNNYRKLPMALYVPKLDITFYHQGINKNPFVKLKNSELNITNKGKVSLNDIYFKTELKTVSKINREKNINSKNNLFIDRPFVIIIKEQYTDAIIFIGQIVNP